MNGAVFAKKPRILLIAAVAKNGVIGRGNALPWRLPEDLKYFRARTLNHAIVMGRNTWESLGRPLPGRRNMVLTRQPGFQAEGAETFGSLEAALAACHDEALFIIGGEQLYRASLDLADQLYLTEINEAFEGDAHFPAFDRRQWQETAREAHISATGLSFAFVTYTRHATQST